MNNDFCTVNEIAEKWNVSPRWVRQLCTMNKIPGAVQFGKAWAIPRNVEKPTDGRITTGEYKNWRNKTKKRHDI